MPREINFTIALLFISVLVASTGTYLDFNLVPDASGYDSYIYLVDLFWLLIICWVAWDLGKKRKDVRLTIILVGAIIVGFSAWDYVELGFSYGLFAYSFEIVIYALMYFLLSKNSAKSWYLNESS